VLAFNATSTSFYARQDIVGSSGGSAISGYSTSTTFRMVGSEGETGLGTSTSGTSFNSCSGFLCSLFKPIYPQYTLTHYHWRNDDGSETTATSGTGGTQDTATSSVPKSATKRLRVEVSNEGGTEESYSAQQFRIEYGLRSTTCSAIVSWTDVGAVGGDWDMSNSTNLTNGNNTTNIATGVGGTGDSNRYFVGTGSVLDTASQTGSVSIPSHSFIELEYAVQALSGATDSATYCFRVTNAGTATQHVYSTYPTATLSGSVSLTLTVSTNSFGSVTPGTAKFATTTIAVNTNNSTGWNASLSGDQKNSTNNNFQLIGASTTQIIDQTEWVPGTATTTVGNAVRISSFVNSQNVLAFRAMSASGTAAFRAGSWWGAADTYADNATTLWAGIPSSTVARQIGNSSVSSGGSDALNTVLYYLNPALTQNTGDYLAPLTVIVTANP
jgi:hypothetical protein